MIFPKSIRWRIQLWHGALLVAVVTTLTFGFYTFESRTRLQAVDTELQELLTPLLPILAPPGGGRPGGPPRFGERLPPGAPGSRRPEILESIRSRVEGGFYYASWTQDGRVIAKSTNAPAGLARPEDDYGPLSGYRTVNGAREFLRHSPGDELVLVGVTIAPLQADLGRLALWLAGAGTLVVVIGIAGGWWLSGRALRPIAQISTAAEKIAGGKLSERINVAETESELGTLAATLNHTFDRLEETVEQQMRFTADASHELRTPLAVMLAETQRALLRERSPEEYRQALAVCERSGERMRTLVNALLELARFDSGEFSVKATPCDLAQLAREALEFIRPLASQKNARLTSQLDAVSAPADASKLGQVLNNLLTNALIHNREGVEISVTVVREGSQAVIRITDNGVGIPPEAMPHLFERFHRVDKARARSQGGSGLGLSICKAIVEAHGGTIGVESPVGKGSTFTVRLPLSGGVQSP